MRSTSTASRSSKRNTIRQLPLTRTAHRPRRSPFNGCSRYSGAPCCAETVQRRGQSESGGCGARVPDSAFWHRPGIVLFVESPQASVDDLHECRSIVRRTICSPRTGMPPVGTGVCIACFGNSIQDDPGTRFDTLRQAQHIAGSTHWGMGRSLNLSRVKPRRTVSLSSHPARGTPGSITCRASGISLAGVTSSPTCGDRTGRVLALERRARDGVLPGQGVKVHGVNRSESPLPWWERGKAERFIPRLGFTGTECSSL